jgi:cytochrome b6-f complex iron-sulfur subunit
MAEKKKMSVAEILAAARAKSDGGVAAPPASKAEAPSERQAVAEGAESSHVEAEAKPKAKPVAKPAAGAAAVGARPSVADILAAARAKKAEGGEGAAVEAAASAAEKPKAASADKPKPAAAAKPKPAAVTSAPKTGVQRDTGSILAAARGGAKPGPVSKAEAPEVTAKLQAAAAKPRVAPVEKVAAVRVAPAMPARPAKPAAKKDGEEDRRGFLEIAMGSFMAMGFTALSVTGGLFTLGLARFMFPNVLAEPPSRFKVGFREGFPAGKVETKFVPQYGVWVVNADFQGQQQIYALKTVCTHLGCTPNWLEAEQKFKCPCHGSGFYKDGVNFEGPAPRPLERYAIRISDDGQLEIDKSKAFQEELGQWADPDSYVTV